MNKDELIHLIDVLRTARNAMNERRTYSAKHWEERFKHVWNREDKEVRETLEAYEEELDNV